MSLCTRGFGNAVVVQTSEYPVSADIVPLGGSSLDLALNLATLAKSSPK